MRCFVLSIVCSCVICSSQHAGISAGMARAAEISLNDGQARETQRQRHEDKRSEAISYWELSLFLRQPSLIPSHSPATQKLLFYQDL